MVEDIDNLKRELEYYKKKFSVAESDIALDGYLAYVALVKQQVEFIKDFKVKEHIEGKKSDTVLYDRATDMGEKLPSMISKMNNLKMELSIEFDDKTGQPKMKASNPQSIGK
jgi:hypothetical protein